jgi:uncharacterized membrane protein (DUF373 family)
MDKYLRYFEKIITVSLIIMMAVVILLATIELGWIIIKDIITPPILLLDINEMLDIFGLFLLVLIGIELVETIKAYLSERVIRVEVVIIVALIAISRKVIILDVKELSSLTLIGIAAIILALSAGYYLLKKRSLKDGRQSTKV